jgi:G patch domain-containing protein 1
MLGMIVGGMDEDDDPYGAGPSGSDHHLAFEHDEEDEVVVMGERPGLGSSSRPAATEAGGANHWHDGRPVLPTFQLDPLGVPTDKW